MQAAQSTTCNLQFRQIIWSQLFKLQNNLTTWLQNLLATFTKTCKMSYLPLDCTLFTAVLLVDLSVYTVECVPCMGRFVNRSQWQTHTWCMERFIILLQPFQNQVFGKGFVNDNMKIEHTEQSQSHTQFKKSYPTNTSQRETLLFSQNNKMST